MKKTLSLALLITGCIPRTREVQMTPEPRTIEPERYALNISEKTLENGAEVVAVKMEKLPIFQVEMELVAGSAYDPAGKEGLANLTVSMLEEGAAGLSGNDVASAVEGMGANMYVSANKNTALVALKCLSPDADSGLSILTKVITSPNLNKADFEKTRKRIVSSIYSAKSDPNTVVNWVFDETFYGQNPLAHPSEGYDSTVAGLKLDDVKSFYRAFYFPANLRVVVVSDLEPESAIALVEKHLGSWKASSSTLPEIPDPAPVVGKTIKVVRMPEINQCYINLGGNGIVRNADDYNALRVANYILGGSGFSSRITKKIRIENGYAYSVWSYFSSGYAFGEHLVPGVFSAGLETKLASGSDAIRMMIGLISDAKAGGFTDDELLSAKKYYTGSIARSGETYGQVAGQVLYQRRFGLPELHWIKDIKAISELNLDQVNAAGTKYLDTDDFVLVVVADTSFTLEGFEGVSYIDWK